VIKTGYSFRTAIGHLSNVTSRLSELKWSAAPIADRGSTFGHVSWSKACREANLRPVYGVEIGVTAEPYAKRPSMDHWVFLAKHRMEDLNALISYATDVDGREPFITYDVAMDADGVIKIAQEFSMPAMIDFDIADLYVGLTPATPRGLYRAARDAGAIFLAMPRNFYPREEDQELYRIMLGRYRANTQTYPMHIVSDAELLDSLAMVTDNIDEAVETRRRVLSECTAELATARLLKYDSPKTLRELCIDGAKALEVDLTNNVYRERMERELDLIREKNFEDYFFIIADLVSWAKRYMVVGPARGSSCGSLVCYLLGITSIDPIPHGLIFERFIDITRADLPDIDLDFSDTNRQMVMDYAERKYGDRVARLGSVGKFQPRSALARVGISLRIPSWQVSKVAETAIKRMMGDSRKSSTIEDTLTDTDAGRAMVKEFPESRIVTQFEGHPDHAGIHAAGLVVTDLPVTKYVAVDKRSKTAMCDKYDAEALNLLKIDVLGLTQLSIFERTMELLGMEPRSGWLEKLPIDDKAAFEVLNRQRYCGVFQFTGAAMRGLAKQIQFESIDDIVAATALVRPGPMASGGTDMWVTRRAGMSQVSYPHPMLKEYLSETYGVMVYQEQVLRIGREIGDLSWADVTALRKAMSKSLGKEYFDKFGDRWKAAAIQKGLPQEVAGKFWNEMCQFGAWAFNKSHSVSYAYVSYWCAYLKAHYPVEFAAATLDAEMDPVKQIAILRELRDEGIGYVPVDPSLSTDKWISMDDGRLLGPLTNIKGIGPAKVADIMQKRKKGDKLTPSLIKLLDNPRTAVDSLYPIRDRVRALYPLGLQEPAPVGLGFTKMEAAVRDCQPGVMGQKLVVVVPTRLIPKDENEPVKVAKRGYKLNGPTQALNMFVRDDDDEMFCKVGRRLYETLGKRIQDHARVGKAIYAIMGPIPENFRMIDIQQARLIGDMEEDINNPEEGDASESDGN
jgi:DNA polymerase III alpha subunit